MRNGRGRPRGGLFRAGAASAFASRHLAPNAVGAVMLYLAWANGLAGRALTADATGLTGVIVAAFTVGLLAVAAGRWRAVRWIAGTLVLLGMVGTVVGFIIALSGIDPPAAGDVRAVTPMVARAC